MTLEIKDISQTEFLNKDGNLIAHAIIEGMSEVIDAPAGTSLQSLIGIAIENNANRVYQKLIDDTGTYIYIGEAIPGTAQSTAGWRITRITVATGDTLYADNVSTFTKVWNNRTTYSYSIGV